MNNLGENGFKLKQIIWKIVQNKQKCHLNSGTPQTHTEKENWTKRKIRKAKDKAKWSFMIFFFFEALRYRIL